VCQYLEELEQKNPTEPVQEQEQVSTPILLPLMPPNAARWLGWVREHYLVVGKSGDPLLADTNIEFGIPADTDSRASSR
jgi:hypothetical protein